MSAPQNMSRKRPAPGTSPVGYQQQNPQLQGNYQGAVQPLTDDQFFNWGANGQDPVSYPNQPMYNMQPNQFQNQAQRPQQAPPPNQSNQLARRPVNNQVVSRPPPQNGEWSQQVQTQQQQQDSPETWSDDINDLLRRAQDAKRESQSKRKQIPPFVMKLHR